jgi:transposase
VIAEKAYDSDAVRARIRDARAKPVLPTRSNRPKRRIDHQRYKLPHAVKRFIGRIKHCRRVATRYDKLAATFLEFVQFASPLTLL